MNAETMILRGLFGASVLACVVMLAAMVTTQPASTLVATGHTVAATSVTASTHNAGTAG
ncbi:hypothetical protein [Dyella sp.]|uniref:hypothetical protein n=1 Tax=Dyella sp. TaxID=1869338 RepID=UPI002B4666C0|nr:hypothetical protein [Dyella sp.]HKT28588.1 hypothetical protein [Dyella sp.]